VWVVLERNALFGALGKGKANTYEDELDRSTEASCCSFFLCRPAITSEAGNRKLVVRSCHGLFLESAI
jgi:hypothetical protein